MRQEVTNFWARITAETVFDDGAERWIHYEIKAQVRRPRGPELTFTVPAAEFAALAWVDTQLGALAVIAAGATNRLVTTAIKERSIAAGSGAKARGLRASRLAQAGRALGLSHRQRSARQRGRDRGDRGAAARSAGALWAGDRRCPGGDAGQPEAPAARAGSGHGADLGHDLACAVRLPARACSGSWAGPACSRASSRPWPSSTMAAAWTPATSPRTGPARRTTSS